MSQDRRVTDIDDGAARRFAALARTVEPEDRRRIAPPADLWDAIASAVDEADLGAGDGDDPASPGPQALSAEASFGTRPAYAPGEDEMEPDDGTHRSASPATGGARVVPLRRRMTAVALSAAAAVVLVLGVVSLVVSGDDEPTGELVATGTLESLAEGFEGDVTLVDVDGRLGLDVEVGALPDATDAYYELWLIKDLDTGEMQSLGPIDGSGRVVLPRGLDPTQYATVDISVEPIDGVPTHSGQSVLRGTLDI